MGIDDADASASAGGDASLYRQCGPAIQAYAQSGNVSTMPPNRRALIGR